jgi:hypothetical protein
VLANDDGGKDCGRGWFREYYRRRLTGFNPFQSKHKEHIAN